MARTGQTSLTDDEGDLEPDAWGDLEDGLFAQWEDSDWGKIMRTIELAQMAIDARIDSLQVIIRAHLDRLRTIGLITCATIRGRLGGK